MSLMILRLLFLLAVLTVSTAALAEEATSVTCVPPRTFPQGTQPCADQKAVYQVALAQARVEHKLLLVVIEATWCPQCGGLAKELPSAAVLGYREADGFTYADQLLIAPILTSTLASGHVMEVASGAEVQAELMRHAGEARMRGWPFLIAVNPERPDQVYARNTDDLLVGGEGSATYDAGQLRRVLREAYARLRHGIEPAPEPGLISRLWRKLTGS